ncbi:MAG: hypothetical protein JW820_13070 [Spirochaetales bacterium]|nr:hypothetical protein [Spirochaetales bacterium]
MKAGLRPLFLALVALLLLCFGGCTSLTVAGRVAVKGSEPHTYLVLVAANQDYKIVGPLREEIWRRYQGQRIRVRGRLVRKAIGPGFPAELEVLEIRKVERPDKS